MKCVMFIYILFISLILIIAEAEANEIECGQYTYKAVRPLLKYIHQMKEEIENNNNTIEGKDKEINQLQEKLAARNEFLIAEQRAQLDFYKQTIQELSHNLASIKDGINKLNSNTLKMRDFEDQLEQQKKTIGQKDQNMSKIENEVNIAAKCDSTDFADAPGIHKINPDREDPFDVLCDSATAGPGWTIIQQRINGKEDFNRNWATCREEFGAFAGEFFLGLEKIHRLTNAQPHELYIHMEGFNRVITLYRYEQFAIAGKDEQYKLITLGQGEGNVTDCLSYDINMKFSIYDRDNDVWGDGNCARHRGGGWWYRSNLNGIYSDLTVVKSHGSFRNTFESLKKVKMLIRPKRLGKL